MATRPPDALMARRAPWDLSRGGRLDAKLFRFVLNNDFISEHASKYGDKRDGIKIYSDFEVEFQLDGHYWLQYGLFLAHIGRFDESIRMLRRSI
jgi:hypothetical protein